MESIQNQRLLVRVARLYYKQDMTQAQIAERLGLSRQKVQRLLRKSREHGLVQITIRPIAGNYCDDERALEGRYGLRETVVVETTADEDQTVAAREVGAAAADYLMRIVRSAHRIVLSWGGTLLEMVNATCHYARPGLVGIEVVQGLGGLGDPNHEAHATELTRRLARHLEGRGLILPAPGLAGTSRAHKAFCSDPTVTDVLDKARSSHVAFMGIGAPRKDSLLIREGSILSWAEMTGLMDHGAVGDINLRYFDEDGKPLQSDLDKRVIGLTLRELKHIGHIVGVAGGQAKFRAVRAALRGQLIDVLITDHVTAQRLLSDREASKDRHGLRSARSR